jgi:hypothetical protein
VKIKKEIKIKVPKDATFDLNVKHGKLNIPKSNTKMSATLSYGDFIGGIIEGTNNLNISNSPVIINTVSSGNITLKNVPNATFGTFSNGNLFSNSSDVIIKTVGKNVALSQKFGNLEVLKIVPDFNNLNIILDYAKGNLILSNTDFIYDLNGKKSTFKVKDVVNHSTNYEKNGVDAIKGFFKNKTSPNKLNITGVYSTVWLH